MSQEATIGETAISNALDHGEEQRQERWAAERADRDEIRASLERPVADLDFPKPKRAVDDDKGLRETLEDALGDAHVSADREERRQKDLERFDLVSQQIKRTHGIEGIDAVEALWNAEQALRRNPEAAIRKLADDYYLSPNLANAAAQREYAGTLDEVNKFFETYEISPAVEALLPSYLANPAFQRSGNYQKDLLRAVADIQRGLGRVRAG